MGCMFHKAFWTIIEFPLKPKQTIMTVYEFDSVLVLGGATYLGGSFDVETASPIFRISTNEGRSWEDTLRVPCNEIRDIYFNDGILLIRTSEYTGDSSLALGAEVTYYKYELGKRSLVKLKFPNNAQKTLVKIFNRQSYLFKEKKGRLGESFLKTTDGGESWSEYTVLMPIETDYFEEISVVDGRIWGIRTHDRSLNEKNDRDFQTLVSINLNTWKIDKDIPMGETIRDEKNYKLNTHWVADIKSLGNTLFILGKDQVKNIGYIWKMDTSVNKIEMYSTFNLKKEQIPYKLFIYGKEIIFIYSDVSSYFPRYTLMYRKIDDSKWKVEKLPEMVSSKINFNNGTLIGVAEKNKLFFRKF